MKTNCRPLLCWGFGAAAVLAVLCNQAAPQDAVKVAPDTYRVLLNNDQVRVLETHLQPGSSSPMHSHPAHVIYGMSDSRVRFTNPDGKSIDATIKAGETAWHEAESHSVKNIGTTEARALLIELKSAPYQTALARAGALLDFDRGRDDGRDDGKRDAAATKFEPFVTIGADRMLWTSLAGVRWQKMMPELGTASPEGAMVSFNPQTNAAQFIYRQAKNAHLPKHWHSANATVVVLNGRMTVKMDKTLDLGPGDFVYVPQKTVMETWTTPEQGCLLLVTTDGPCSATWVDGTPKPTDAVGAEATRTESAHHVFVRSKELQWNDGPASLPPGAKLAVLAGDPSNPQPFTMRIRVPAGYRIAPHHHPADENVTVISGSFVMGTGVEFNTEYGEKLAAGDFVMMPAGTHHFVEAQEETTVEIHGIGPWGITYVNPADDPRINTVTQP